MPADGVEFRAVAVARRGVGRDALCRPIAAEAAPTKRPVTAEQQTSGASVGFADRTVVHELISRCSIES